MNSSTGSLFIQGGRMIQDPFLPQSDAANAPQGPTFLDTEACLCALRPSPQNSDVDPLWKCMGNQTRGVYTSYAGKWFKTQHGFSNYTQLPIDDSSNPPDTTSALFWDYRSEKFVSVAPKNSLSIYDSVCTGQNRSSFSTTFYQAQREQENGDTPIHAAPCWRPGAVPVQIQNISDWQAIGCKPGFLCTNNTANSLPQYCPPWPACQTARLAGRTCSLNGTNLPMGPFEPVVCQAGNYCPVSSRGRETFVCPKGSYCQPGAASPTPCAAGSACPEGSSFGRYLVPIIVLVIIDILLALGIILHSTRRRLRKGDSSSTKPRGMPSALARRITGYKAIPDDGDHEQAVVQSTYHPYSPHRESTWVGFETAVFHLDPRSPTPITPLQRRGTFLTPQVQSFINSMKRAIDDDELGLSFQYSNLSFHPKSSAKPVLQNVTGSIQAGSLVAVMGGSGAGKSTFVNVLMGKTVNTGGTVSINNVPDKIKRYKKLIGYVPQDDIVLPELTVYENIVHAAKIRLPRTWTNADIEAHVSSVIDCLELSHVRDSRVGSVGKPVLSGGQRKRVSIGMELAAAPMAIFLDEPTSGLDATAASSIMRTLKALARLGISVIVIIHQPRMEIFDMIDDLILLGNGQLIYEGPEREVQGFFEKVGFQFPQHANYGDVVTDIITGNGRPYKKIGDISKEALISHWAGLQAARETKADQATSAVRKTMHQLLRNHRGASRLAQAWLCLRRSMVQQYRTKSTFWFEMGLAALAGFLLGLAESPKKGVLFQGPYAAPYDILSNATDVKSAPELALLIAIAVGLVSAAPGVKVFSDETLLQRREAEAGHSRLAYFLAKTVGSLPRMLMACLHFSAPLFLLAVPIIPFGTAFLANLLYFFCIYGLAACVSMAVRREDAPLFATMLSLIVGILCGAAPPLRSAKDWNMEWLWRASPAVWFAEVYFGQLVSPFAYLYDVDFAAQATGYYLDRLGANMGVLFAIGCLYRVVAFIGLFVGKRWRL